MVKSTALHPTHTHRHTHQICSLTCAPSSALCCRAVSSQSPHPRQPLAVPASAAAARRSRLVRTLTLASPLYPISGFFPVPKKPVLARSSAEVRSFSYSASALSLPRHHARQSQPAGRDRGDDEEHAPPEDVGAVRARQMTGCRSACDGHEGTTVGQHSACSWRRWRRRRGPAAARAGAAARRARRRAADGGGGGGGPAVRAGALAAAAQTWRRGLLARGRRAARPATAACSAVARSKRPLRL